MIGTSQNPHTDSYFPGTTSPFPKLPLHTKITFCPSDPTITASGSPAATPPAHVNHVGLLRDGCVPVTVPLALGVRVALCVASAEKVLVVVGVAEGVMEGVGKPAEAGVTPAATKSLAVAPTGMATRYWKEPPCAAARDPAE